MNKMLVILIICTIFLSTGCMRNPLSRSFENSIGDLGYSAIGDIEGSSSYFIVFSISKEFGIVSGHNIYRYGYYSYVNKVFEGRDASTGRTYTVLDAINESGEYKRFFVVTKGSTDISVFILNSTKDSPKDYSFTKASGSTWVTCSGGLGWQVDSSADKLITASISTVSPAVRSASSRSRSSYRASSSGTTARPSSSSSPVRSGYDIPQTVHSQNAIKVDDQMLSETPRRAKPVLILD